ncbi:MAG: EAL domain-containing protein [Lachnospiraceae bacterium]|nr:EAL domain-containing protein [Lachnospiraceae bacterium]
MDPAAFIENFTPVGDIVVLAVCIVFFMLFRTSYINRTKTFSIFLYMVFTLTFATVSDLLFHTLYEDFHTGFTGVLSLLWLLHVLALFLNLVAFVFYVLEALRLSQAEAKKYKVVSVSLFALFSVYEALGMIFRFGFYFLKNGKVHPGEDIFIFAYYFFMGEIIFLLLWYRKMLFRRIIYGIISVCILSLAIMFIQGLFNQISFTTAAFLLPLMALMYLAHSNPYDVEIGSVNLAAFEDTISYNLSRDRKLIMLSLFMHDFEGSGKKYPKDIRAIIRHYMDAYLKGSILFRVAGGHIILVAPIDRNPEWQLLADRMIDDFYGLYPIYKYDYKIVVLTTVDELSRDNEYIGFIQNVETRMPENSVHYVEDKDIAIYYDQEYFLRELEDIQRNNNLEDERVVVYCQPVLNLVTGKYDTAEALMRLNLPGRGMVYPDRFIPLAERFGYVHTITRIILYKTCLEIKKLIDEGYEVKRISINVAAEEMRSIDFSKDIIKVIVRSGIPFEKIAIEVTESQNESDFKVVKQIIDELKGNGIKFYLDDFGTGYSNFERIMELPFDIIKFDRSLVLASGENAKFEMMVSHLARMFSDLEYSVLYEGIENDRDESMCRSMCARYLQGYKYSKPIPIADLRKYFDKSGR